MSIINDNIDDIAEIDSKQVIVESSYTQNADTASGVLDYATGDRVEITAGSDLTISYTGFIAGKVCSMIIDAVNWGTYSITFPVGTLFAYGEVPTFTDSGKDTIIVEKDKDEVYSVFIVGLDVK